MLKEQFYTIPIKLIHLQFNSGVYILEKIAECISLINYN